MVVDEVDWVLPEALPCPGALTHVIKEGPALHGDDLKGGAQVLLDHEPQNLGQRHHGFRDHLGADGVTERAQELL